MIIRLLRRLWFLPAMTFSVVEDGGGGDAGDVSPPEPAAPSAEAPAAAQAPAAEPSKPASMLDAISQHLDAQEATDPATGQPRDDKGRFAPKAGDTPAVEPAKPAAVAATPAKPAEPAKPAAEAPEDMLQMPEGLQPKAQQRFQQLVAANKEATAKADQLEAQVSYVRDTFQQHGIKREQFEGATNYIGAINRGDLKTARDLLIGQLRELSLAMGEPMPGVDALVDHADLRGEVDSGRITEAHALELARHRRATMLAQQNAEQQQAQQAQQQQEQQAVQKGLADIDAFCKQMAGVDLDFPHIEEQLLPEIQNLISGLPPQRWKQAIETQYRLLKRVAGASRGAASAGAGTVLRPTGAASPAARPKTAYEAMWGRPAPSA